jgi:hypothetical protein
MAGLFSKPTFLIGSATVSSADPRAPFSISAFEVVADPLFFSIARKDYGHDNAERFMLLN